VKYERSKISASAPVFFISELGDDELYAHAAVETRREHGLTASAGLTPEGGIPVQAILNELDKLGISMTTLSAAWHIDEDTIERVALGKQNMPSDYGWDKAREIREVNLPIDSIAIRAPQSALEPAPLAAGSNAYNDRFSAPRYSADDARRDSPDVRY
jgi:hypothetical protein